jgi:hypothetical protein
MGRAELDPPVDGASRWFRYTAKIKEKIAQALQVTAGAVEVSHAHPGRRR